MISTKSLLDDIQLTGQNQFLHLVPSIKQVKSSEEMRFIPFCTLQEKQSTQNHIDFDDADTRGKTVPYLKPIKNQSKFTALQKWEGFVLEVGQETFTARLVDLKNEGIEEEAEIYLNEITPEDYQLLKPGAIFYWSIGYLDHYGGQRFNTGMIRFRRLPGFSKQEIQLAQEKADEIIKLFGWNNP